MVHSLDRRLSGIEIHSKQTVECRQWLDATTDYSNNIVTLKILNGDETHCVGGEFPWEGYQSVKLTVAAFESRVHHQTIPRWRGVVTQLAVNQCIGNGDVGSIPTLGAKYGR